MPNTQRTCCSRLHRRSANHLFSHQSLIVCHINQLIAGPRPLQKNHSSAHCGSPMQSHHLAKSFAMSIPMLPHLRHVGSFMMAAFLTISLDRSICIRKSSQSNFAALILPFRQPGLDEVPCMCPPRMNSTIIKAIFACWMPPNRIGMFVVRQFIGRPCHDFRFVHWGLRCWRCNNWIAFVVQSRLDLLQLLRLWAPKIICRTKLFEWWQLTRRIVGHWRQPIQTNQYFLSTPNRPNLIMLSNVGRLTVPI